VPTPVASGVARDVPENPLVDRHAGCAQLGCGMEVAGQTTVWPDEVTERSQEGSVAKQGMHHNDHRDSDVSRGHNKHEKSTPITTGSYKKRATTEKQVKLHQPTNKQAQYAKNEWLHDTHHPPSKIDRIGHGRSGSDSNAS
jgi:hypothetical protein